MIKELNINHKQVSIQYPKTDIKELPVVILHAYNEEEGRADEYIQELIKEIIFMKQI